MFHDEDTNLEKHENFSFRELADFFFIAFFVIPAKAGMTEDRGLFRPRVRPCPSPGERGRRPLPYPL